MKQTKLLLISLLLLLGGVIDILGILPGPLVTAESQGATKQVELDNVSPTVFDDKNSVAGSLITVTFKVKPSAISAYKAFNSLIWDSSKKIILRNGVSYEVIKEFGSADVTTNASSINLKMPDGVKYAPGSYEIIIPAGTFTGKYKPNVGSETTATANDEIKQTITVKATPGTWLTISGSTPSEDELVPEWNNLSSLSLTFTALKVDSSGAAENNPGLIEEIKWDSTATQNIELRKDGTSVVSFAPNSSLVKFNGSIVTFDFPSGTTLAAGNYELYIPASTLNADQAFSAEGGDSDSQEEVTFQQEALTLPFSIVETPRFTTTPASGTTMTQLAGGLNTVRIDYEGINTLSVSSAYAAQSIKLYLFNGTTNSREEYGYYTPAVDGNSIVLTLVPATGKTIKEQTNRMIRYQVHIPAGAFDMTTTSGASASSIKVIISELNVKDVLFDPGDPGIKLISPELPLTFTPSGVPQEFVLELPVQMDTPTSDTKATLNMGTSTTGVATYLASEAGAAGDGYRYRFTLQPPSATTTSRLNSDPRVWESGEYSFKLAEGALTKTIDGSKKKAPAMTFSGLTMKDGITHQPIVRETVNVGISNKEYVYYPLTDSESPFDGIKTEVGVRTLRVTYVSSVKCTGSATAKVALYKAGSDTPLWAQGSVPNTDRVWMGAVGTAVSTTSPYVGFLIPYDESEYLTEAGTYILKIDEGFFETSSPTVTKYYNAETAIQFTITDADYVATPSSGSSLSSISEVVLKYPDAKAVSVNGTPEIKIVNQDLGAGEMGTFTISASGNSLTMTLAEPITELSRSGYVVTIPAGTLTITNADNSTYTNAEIKLVYKLDRISKGLVDPEENLEAEEGYSPDMIAGIMYGSNVLVNEINGSAYLYAVTDGVRGETPVMEFAGCMISEETGDIDEDNNPSRYLGWIADEAVIMSLSTGIYEFVIPMTSLTHAFGTPEAEEFTYRYKIVNDMEALEDHITLSLPSSLNANPLNTQNRNMSVIGLGIDDEAIVAAESAVKISLSYKATAASDATLLTELSVNNEEQVSIIGVSIGDVKTAGTIYMLFGEETAAQYKQDGIYVLTIPDGAFYFNGSPMKGLELEYNFSNSVDVDTTCELTPAEGTRVSQKNGVALPVTVYFPNATNSVTYGNTCPGKLTMPSGKILTVNYPKLESEQDNKRLIFNFGGSSTVWEPGTYTFTVAAKKIFVDMDPEYFSTGNSQAISLKFDVNTNMEASGLKMVEAYGNGNDSHYRVQALAGADSKDVEILIGHNEKIDGSDVDDYANYLKNLKVTFSAAEGYDSAFGLNKNQRTEIVKDGESYVHQHEGETGQGYSIIKLRPFTAQVANINVKLESELECNGFYFQPEELNIPIRILPTVESIGLAFNGVPLIPNAGGEYPYIVFVDPNNNFTQDNVVWNPTTRGVMMLCREADIAGKKHPENTATCQIYWKEVNPASEPLMLALSDALGNESSKVDENFNTPGGDGSLTEYSIGNSLKVQPSDREKVIEIQPVQNGIAGVPVKALVTTDKERYIDAGGNLQTGVDGVEVTRQEAPVYYDLNGLRIDADRLVPGFYIEVRDGESRKVYVK